MNRKHIDRLLSANIITEEKHSEIIEWQQREPFSLHWEMRLIMYIGILVLTSGLGILIYKNIETIGHTVIILLIASACAGCFYYCVKNKIPYSNERVFNVSPFYDYILLLACLLFIALETYLQYQYALFGVRYGIATLIPALLFIFVAYYFDHIGVLAMGITALTSFAGISASPGMLLNNEIYESSLIFTGFAHSIVLIGAGYYLKSKSIKRHFTFSYYNFGFNLLLICLVASLYTLSLPFIYLLILLFACFLLARFAIKEKSFYFLLMAVVYAYVGITWAVFTLEMGYLFGLYYFVISCIGVLYFLIYHKRILKIK